MPVNFQYVIDFLSIKKNMFLEKFVSFVLINQLLPNVFFSEGGHFAIEHTTLVGVWL